MQFLLFAAVAFAGSTIGGSMALGAVLITTPLLDLVAGGALDFKQIGVLNLILVLTGTLTSALFHHRGGYVDRSLFVHLAPVGAVGALAGGAVAHFASDATLRWTFVGVAFASLLLGLLPVNARATVLLGRGLRSPAVTPPENARWWRVLGGALAATLVSGFVGVGGGLLITPFLMKLARFPAKTVVGTMTAVGVVTTVCALAGRIGTTPLPPWIAIAGVMIGAIGGGALGARLTHVIPARALAPILSVVVVLSASQIIVQQLLTAR